MYAEVLARLEGAGLTPEAEGADAVMRDTIAELTGGAVELDDATIAAVYGAEDAETAYAELAGALNAAGGINYSTTGHSAVDVPIYAYGTGADRFEGLIDNTDVGNQLAAAMGLELPEGQAARTDEPVAATEMDTTFPITGVSSDMLLA